MGRDESTKMAELKALRETTERARIVSVERERMIELDISLARVESTALDERIETIRDRVHRLEGEQDRTNAILERKMKTTATTASMLMPSSSSSSSPPLSSLSSSLSSSSPSLSSPSLLSSRTAVDIENAIVAVLASPKIVPETANLLTSPSATGLVIKEGSPLNPPPPSSPSSPALLSSRGIDVADGPSSLKTVAIGALVLGGAGGGAALFLNKDKDEGPVGDEGSSSRTTLNDPSSPYFLREGPSSSSYAPYGDRDSNEGAVASVSMEDQYSRTITDRVIDGTRAELSSSKERGISSLNDNSISFREKSGSSTMTTTTSGFVQRPVMKSGGAKTSIYSPDVDGGTKGVPGISTSAFGMGPGPGMMGGLAKTLLPPPGVAGVNKGVTANLVVVGI